ncbi:MAG: hypothetical protein HKN21_08425, partial [Candidatus Eisenbacteria bacterium]|nr:hypothetical protein [Candidatus Eisenbacteria bacterium]
QDRALVELSAPRYLALVSYNSGSLDYLDFGIGSEIENFGVLERSGSLLFLGAVLSPHNNESATVARALLEVEEHNFSLVRALPLDRDGYSRGFAVDDFRNTAFLLEEYGTGEGSLRRLDLSTGRMTHGVNVGPLPGTVSRRGLVHDPDTRTLFCLVGGAEAHDFAPVGEESDPGILVFKSDSLDFVQRIPLPRDAQPQALAFEPDRRILLVLASQGGASQVYMFDASFLDLRSQVSLPELVTDLTLSGPYAYAPGSRGVYVVDTVSSIWAPRPAINLEQTGEIAISPAGDLALVQFHATYLNDSPGVVLIDMNTGEVLESWR